MKFLVVIATLATIALAVEQEHSADHKKRGVPKTSAINAIPSNGHQKPETLNYVNYQQQPGPVTQAPLYPLAPNSYSQEDVNQGSLNQQQQNQQQQTFNYVPQQQQQQQIVPLQFIQQPFVMPKYQLVTMKSANGQAQLTLIPQNYYQGFGQSAFIPLQQSILGNAAQAQLSQSSPTSQSATNQNTYVTPQSVAYTTQAANLASQGNYYQNPQALHFGQGSFGQPSTMLVFAQPSHQLYNNYLAPPSNLLYSQAGQQLLNYYQTNPQAKYQLLYGNQGQQQSQGSSYQQPLSGTEYEKTVSGPVQQSLSSSKSEIDLGLNTNEYISPPDTQFRPIPSYGRGPGSYKN